MKRTDAPAKQPKPFGINGPREPILATTPAGDNTASYDVGFPPITMTLKSAGGLPPKGQDMNQILYELSALGRWASSGSLNSYDASFSTAIGGYPAGSFLIGDDGVTIYVNTTDSNTTNPNTGGAGWVTLNKFINVDRLDQQTTETRLKSPDSSRYIFVRDDGVWGGWQDSVGAIALGIGYGGTGAGNVPDALANLGIGPIATAAEVTAGTSKKLVDAARLIGAIATDADIQNATAKKLVDAAGLINAITTMQDIQNGALRKLVNAQSLKNYLPTKTLGASGFIRIPDVPGGTIIQWGQVVKSITEGLENVVLPTPFPTSGRFAIAIPLNQSGNSSIDIIPHLVAASQTGINFYFSWGTTSTPADGFQWLALGY